jgi:hypothetical protein
MSIVFMTGSHPRHSFMARAIARSGRLAGVVFERRENHLPAPPAGLPEATRALFVRHFAGRAASEARFFGTETSEGHDGLPGVEVLNVELTDLNGPRTWAFLDRLAPDLLLSYGVHKLTPETLSHAPGLRWNIHGGLSPWYRGVTTHFWPSYMLEPQMTGMTVHELTEAIDGGDVIHQTAAELVRDDGIHDLACRAVMGLAAEMPELARRALDGRVAAPRRQTTTGRIWRSTDWRPAHLHPIYDHYGNRIVDRFLDGEFGGEAPRLVRQFDATSAAA